MGGLEPFRRQVDHTVHVEHDADAFDADQEAPRSEQFGPRRSTLRINIDQPLRAAEVRHVFEQEGTSEAERLGNLAKNDPALLVRGDPTNGTKKLLNYAQHDGRRRLQYSTRMPRTNPWFN